MERKSEPLLPATSTLALPSPPQSLPSAGVTLAPPPDEEMAEATSVTLVITEDDLLDDSENGHPMLEAEVTNTFPLYTDEDYKSPLRLVGKSFLYVLFFPLIFLLFLLPKLLKKLCNTMKWVLGHTCKGMYKLILKPLYKIILKPSYEAISWCCNKLTWGASATKNFIHHNILVPCWGGVKAVGRGVRDNVLVPFWEGVKAIGRGVRDNVLVPFWEGVKAIGRGARDYIAIPLKNLLVYVIGKFFEGVRFALSKFGQCIISEWRLTSNYYG